VKKHRRTKGLDMILPILALNSSVISRIYGNSILTLKVGPSVGQAIALSSDYEFMNLRNLEKEKM